VRTWPAHQSYEQAFSHPEDLVAASSLMGPVNTGGGILPSPSLSARSPVMIPLGAYPVIGPITLAETLPAPTIAWDLGDTPLTIGSVAVDEPPTALIELTPKGILYPESTKLLVNQP
jgi:hypothetical protein